MIAIHDEGAGSGRRWLARLKWGALLCAMVLIYGSHAPLIALSKVDGRVPFQPSSCALMVEVAKLLASLATLVGSQTRGRRVPLAPSSPSTVAAYAVPAALYALNNNLVVVMQADMDPSSFQVLGNLKIAATAALYSACLGKKLRRGQWLGLGLLMAAGACHGYSSLGGAQAGDRLHVTPRGLVLVLAYCSVSGLAAVYTEKMLKSRRLPLSLQNVYLYSFGALLNGLASFSALAGEKSLLEGYSWTVWAMVAGQAANGLSMSLVLKHGSGVTRLFVISCSLLVNAVLSWALLGLQLTSFFLLPVAMVALAAYLYYK
ncbi:putative UDP-sugar transporter protein SLC35A4 [Stigmatopora nigra]